MAIIIVAFGSVVVIVVIVVIVSTLFTILLMTKANGKGIRNEYVLKQTPKLGKTSPSNTKYQTYIIIIVIAVMVVIAIT